MAHYDHETNTVVRYSPVRDPFYEGWLQVDCGCSNGLEWGGEVPRECRDCNGTGWRSVHIASGTVSQYPGGPLAGSHLRKEEVSTLLRALPKDVA